MPYLLDSNILLSALLSPGGPPHQIFEAWRARRFELVTCPTQLEEIRRASRYPRLRNLLQPARVGAMVNALAPLAHPDPPAGTYELADPHDAWLLALADVAGADWLITGDRRSGLLARKSVSRARIVTAAAFCELSLGQSA